MWNFVEGEMEEFREVTVKKHRNRINYFRREKKNNLVDYCYLDPV